MRARLLLFVAACSSPPHERTVQQPPLANTQPALAVVALAQPPTLATAGAATCRELEPVLLGPRSGEHAVLAFDRDSGLAAWLSAKDTLAIQPIGRAGQKLGGVVSIALPAGVEPHAIHPLGGRFFALLRLWDWENSRVAWWGVVLDPRGHAARPLTELGLADLDLVNERALDGGELIAQVGPATISKNPQQATRWQRISISEDGAISSRPATTLPGPVPVLPGDALAYDVTNGARPPPRGPNGTIYEAMGRPMLERTHGGQPVGETLALEWHGNSIATGMYISAYIVWSGTHFLYPFQAEDGERLLPIDCAP